MYGENKSKLFWSVSHDNEDTFLVGVINDTLDSIIRGSEYLEKVLEIIENTDGVGGVIRSIYGKSNDFYIEFKYTVDTFIRVSGNLFDSFTVSMFSVFGHFVDCGATIHNEDKPIVVDNVVMYNSQSNSTDPAAVFNAPYAKHTPVMTSIIEQLIDWEKNYQATTIEFCPGGKEETDEE